MGALCCPTCGHSLTKKEQFAGLLEASLSMRHRAIVEALVTAHPREIGTSALFDALYGLDPNGGPDSNVLPVLLHQLRHHVLPPMGWTITSGQRGRGNPGRYRLEKTEG